LHPLQAIASFPEDDACSPAPFVLLGKQDRLFFVFPPPPNKSMHIHEPIQEIDAVSHEVLTCVLKNIFDMKICVADFF
jgi:hypothetical protein